MARQTRLIPAARVEERDIAPGFIWAAVSACAGMLTVCALLVVWLYPSSIADRRIDAPLPVYPAPRLQPDPAADMRGFKAREMARLDGAGWVDPARGIAHIPIDQAMDEITREGIVGWPTAPGSP